MYDITHLLSRHQIQENVQCAEINDILNIYFKIKQLDFLLIISASDLRRRSRALQELVHKVAIRHSPQKIINSYITIKLNQIKYNWTALKTIEQFFFNGFERLATALYMRHMLNHRVIRGWGAGLIPFLNNAFASYLVSKLRVTQKLSFYFVFLKLNQPKRWSR